MLPAANWILLVIKWAGAIVGLFAFLHAVTQRKDAYTAADRKTKVFWGAVTGAGTAALVLFSPTNGGFIFWVAGLVAVLVYLVDVRPKLNEVQKGGRNR